MISNEEIKEFLEGGDPEQFIVSIEFDYVTDAIYKIKEVPGQGKSIQKEIQVKLSKFLKEKVYLEGRELIERQTLLIAGLRKSQQAKSKPLNP